jgi:alanyl-tRNA synthetase
VARLGDLLKSPKDSIEERLTATIDELKSAQRKLAQLQAAELATKVPALVSSAETAGAFKIVAENFGQLDSVDDLRSLAAQTAGAKAGALVRAASAVLGGGGGGKDDIAQGGGSDVSRINDAISAVKAAL